jgi:hypothetical protein
VEDGDGFRRDAIGRDCGDDEFLRPNSVRLLEALVRMLMSKKIRKKEPTSTANVSSQFDDWINSPETVEFLRKLEEKEKRAEERRLAMEAKREAEREERRQNPKSPIDAYYNHMEECPYGWWETKKRRAWKKENPTFDFNGVTYQDHWSPELSNSGKTTRWMGYLTSSDGSTIEIKNEHINNRRNDAKRNWGLPE